MGAIISFILKKMSFKKDLGKIVSVLMIGLPACNSQQVVEALTVQSVQEPSQEAQPTQELDQNVSINSESSGVLLIYDSEVKFADSFPIQNGTHHLKVWRDDERKISIIELKYEDGFVEKYWDSNCDKSWDSVEEVNDRTITFYSRIPKSFLEVCDSYVLDIQKSDEEKEQAKNYWLQRKAQWQNKVAEFDAKYSFLKKTLKERINL